MSDLIERQAALDAVNDCGICIQKILDIPSAELETFEFCSGGDNPCKEYDQEKHCCHRWTKVIRQTVEDMKNRWKWIPVTEALPNNEEYDWVLGQIRETDSGYLWIPRQVEYREIKDDWYEDSIGWLKENPDHAFEVIAWMPLPEPWKGE